MKAAFLDRFGSPLVVRDAPDPVVRPGDVLVDVFAAPVAVYAKEVFSGERALGLVPPLLPGGGAIARVHALGADATRLAVGDWVYCDPTIRSRDDAIAPDVILQGWVAPGEGGRRLHGHWHDGAFAERMLLPTENAIRIGDIDDADAERWCALGVLLVPYGGFLAADFQPGETALVSGATGQFGSAAVAVALAMGARCVVATGRNEIVLDDLVRRFGSRVRPVRVTGKEGEDRARIVAVAGAVDCALDILPPVASVTMTRAAALSVRPGGRIVLMGGIDQELALPYRHLMRNNVTVRGQWLYPRHAPARMIGMIRAGLVDLRQFRVDAFPLARANEAVEHASREGGAFRLTVLRP